MEKSVTDIFESLQKLIGLHRELLDICRGERQALVQADIKAIQDATFAKQGLVESIRKMENERLKCLNVLALVWKKPLHELSLPKLMIALQGEDPEAADLFRTTYNALTVLIQRITEQNEDNRLLVERSLEHVNEMKKNVLGEAVPKSNTYTSRGERVATTGGARLISKEI